jgi:phosphoribosylformylglycinamidine (FGAM) synthase PurS component
MPPRPATLSEADVNRVLRAARKNGAREVEVTAAGITVKITLGENSGEKAKAKIEPARRRLL